ncbi:hypothetical protein COT83_04500, partial [Candidatus Peregrinibacteria bacterium CG10_big_fil_rev_8_21_14_0_10_44_7]
TLQCALYGYEHKSIPPAYPRANSHVERTHRIDVEEVYKGKTLNISMKNVHTNQNIFSLLSNSESLNSAYINKNSTTVS